jgi:hypothetical protein
MKEIPILFSTPMVQANLEGRKKMTRRMTGLDNVNEDPDKVEFVRFQQYKKDGSYRAIFQHEDADGFGSVKCPYGQLGDVLWVRETWCLDLFNKNVYKATDGLTDGVGRKFTFSPSIHMPKSAARIWLQVEEIRVERLNEITRADAIAEGIKVKYLDGTAVFDDYACPDSFPYPFISARESFKSLFLSINGKPKPQREHGETGKILCFYAIAWDQEDYDRRWAKYNGIYRNKSLHVIINPWVWVVKYKVLSTTGKPKTEPG